MVTRDKFEMKLLLKSVMRPSFRGYATTAIGFTAVASHMTMEQAAYSSVTKVVLMRNEEQLTLCFLVRIPR